MVAKIIVFILSSSHSSDALDVFATPWIRQAGRLQQQPLLLLLYQVLLLLLTM